MSVPWRGYRKVRARLANMQLLEASALEIDQQNDMDIRIWKEATQSNRVALYEMIRELSQHAEDQATEFRQLRDDRERALAATKSAVTVRSDKLTATAKTLAELANERALTDELAFYKDFFTRVRASIDDLEAKAKTDAAAAQTTAAEQAKALGDAVALGFPDERRAGRDPEKAQLVLEIVAHVLAAVIVARLQARRDPLGVGAEDRVYPCRNGSTASKRVPGRAAWRPMHSAAQWSTTTKTVAVPSRRVRQLVASIPHI